MISYMISQLIIYNNIVLHYDLTSILILTIFSIIVIKLMNCSKCNNFSNYILL